MKNIQGDSAYYYEYTLGSTHEWWYSGLEEQELASFAISVLRHDRVCLCADTTRRMWRLVCLNVTVLMTCGVSKKWRLS